MFQSWLMNSLNFLLPALAVLLITLYQHRLVRLIGALGHEDLKHLFEHHTKRMRIAMGLLSAWLILQYLPLLFA